jgi:hypothetical protein
VEVEAMSTDVTAAEKFILSRGLEWQQLLKYAQRFGRRDGVLLVGSIAEGLAVADSDIDLLLLGCRDKDVHPTIDAARYETSIQRSHSGVGFNVEHWGIDDLTEIEGRLSVSLDAINNPVNIRRVELFSLPELTMLHRLRTGLPIANPDVVTEWRRCLRTDELSGYMVLSSISDHFAYREDVIGQSRTQRTDSALYMLGFAVSAAASFTLASIGETNPEAKWRVSLVQQHRHAIGEALADALLQYLVPTRPLTFEDIRGALKLSDTALAQVMPRRPDLLSAFTEFSKRVKFELQI